MKHIAAFFSTYRFCFALAVCLGVLAAAAGEISVFQGWQHDLGVKLTPRPSTDDIVIVAIDERSLEKLGRWPWSRNVHAQLIDKLANAGVKAIAMDIFFIEAEQEHPEADQELAQAIQHHGGVVLPIILDENNSGSLEIIMPLTQLSIAAANLGFVNLSLGTDGVLRGINMQAEIAGMHFSNLAQALLNVVNHKLPSTYKESVQGSHSLQMQDYRLIMSFPAAHERFQRVSYWDVLTDASVTENLKGKTVLVGMTATGLAPHFNMPVLVASELMSGVEINANTFAALQAGLTVTPISPLLRILFTFFLVFSPILLLGFLSAKQKVVVLSTFSMLSVVLSLLLFKFFALWYGPFIAIVGHIISYPLWNLHRQKRLAQHLLQEKEQANTTLHAIGNAVITTNADGVIEFMNPVAEVITGHTLAEAQGQAIDQIVTLKKDVRGEIFSAIRNFLAADKSVITTKPLSLLNQHNQKYAIRITANAIRDPSGTIKAIVFALSDISEIIAVSRKIKHLATHDALTQLPNRTLLEDRLTKAINMGERHFSKFALLFVDLDGFKKINDNQGHNVGDGLLKEVAMRLSAQKRKTDTVARWGGDEFVILLEDIPHEEVVVEIAKGIIRLLSTPFKIEGYELRISPSIGISVYPKDGYHTEELLEKADVAMYQVKRTGRNNYCFYRPDLENGVLS
ncbi:MAG: diguanylate cyclase [Methylococcales bacterium]